MKTGTKRNRPRPLTSRLSKVRPWCAYFLTICMAIYGIAPIAVSAQTTVSGNISPHSIQIDNTASFYTGDSKPFLNAGADRDWVLDVDPNSDVASFENGIALGLIDNLTAAVGGKGHWNGVRIVDRHAGADLDIFGSGGKVNLLSTWNIKDGSVGSGKYDATQAFIANNQLNVFFGMMRRSNDGTTAYEWEFNVAAPPSLPGSPNNGYVPTRTPGDKLLTFEFQGSSTNLAFLYISEWNGTEFLQVCDNDPNTVPADDPPDPDDPLGDCDAPGLFLSVNDPGTKPPPWGYVNTHGNWLRDDESAPLTKFESIENNIFAEAQVPLSFLPGVDNCGGSAFVQVRTRSSRGLTSDAKDATPIFEYLFGGPKAEGELDSGCGLNISYDATGSTNAAGGTSNLTYEWRFEKLVDGVWVDAFAGDGPDRTDLKNDPNNPIVAPGPGTYRANLKVIEGGTCVIDINTNSVTVYDPVGGSASLVGDCDDTFTYSATGSGGSGSYVFEWTIYKNDGDNDLSGSGDAGDLVAKTFTDTGTSSGTLDVDDFNIGAKGDGQYYGIVRIKDANNTDCFADRTTNAINVRHPLTVTLAKSDRVANVNNADGSFYVVVGATVGNSAGDGIDFAWEQSPTLVTNWGSVGGNTSSLNRTMTDIIGGGSAVLETPLTILGNEYSLVRTSLKLRVTVSRQLTGLACPITSDPFTIRSIKAIDP